MAPVGAKLKGGPLTEVAKLAHHREPAAPLPRAAAVGNELVTLDAKRRLPLDDLARRVPDVRRRVGNTVEPVAVGAAAPVSHHVKKEIEASELHDMMAGGQEPVEPESSLGEAGQALCGCVRSIGHR